MYKWIKNNTYTRNFSPIDLDTNKIEGDADLINNIGGWFVSDTKPNTKINVYSITPLHGRVAAHFNNKTGWTLIKGVGWTYGGPAMLVSPKDTELYFGLCDASAAKRELEVSKWMVKNKIRVTPILGYAPISKDGFKNITFRNGKPVVPVLLYTRVICPLRVMDLAYLTDTQKKEAIALAASFCGWNETDFLQEFFSTLVGTVSEFQSLGCCNDTLDANNVTLAAEITDFEWVSVPGIPLPWGDGTLEIDSRQQKEIIYLYEIGIQLAAFLQICDPSDKLIEIIADVYSNKLPHVQPIINTLYHNKS